MQNKTAIWLFTILLAIACLYQLSFGWVVSGVEADAEAYAEDRHIEVQDSLMRLTPAQYEYKMGQNTIAFADSNGQIDSAGLARLKNYFEQQYLIGVANQSVYPLFGHTYQYCKNHQLNLGLDLQGGMSVTLEVSTPDLVKNMAGKQAEYQTVFMEPFKAALVEHSTTDVDFVTLFEKHWNLLSADEKMTRFFSVGTPDKFDDDFTNEQVIAILKEQAAISLGKIEEVIVARINKFGVSQPDISRDPATGRIHLELPGVKDKQRVRNLVVQPANLEFWETVEVNDIFVQSVQSVKTYLLNEEKKALGVEVAEDLDSIPVMDTSYVYTDTVNGLAVADTVSTPKVDSNLTITPQLLVDTSYRAYTKAELDSIQKAKLAGINPWDTHILESVPGLWPSGILGYVPVGDTGWVNRNVMGDPTIKQLLPPGVELRWSYKSKEVGDLGNVVELYAIQESSDGKARLTGEDLEEASYSVDMDGGNGWQINMLMTSNGATEWENWTGAKVGEPIAILMDDEVYSAPNIISKISGGSSRITGNFTFQEVEDIVNVLEGGSLLAPPKIIDEATVGPTLGQENIDSGLMSFAIAIALVLIYMIFYYAKAGLVSDIALVANIFFIVGTLASLGAALTLPGIAGIVLTIGMSVDANVLIYERIREEVRAGKGTRLAITDGYKHAYSAIVDANLTTLFTAIVLAYFGSGPIKGFAITLIIGIFTSLFSAIFITRLIFTYMLERKKNITFSSKATENVFANASYKFIKKRKIFYVISAIVILGGIGSLATKGLDAGVEFSGGRYYHITFNESQTQENLKSSLTASFEGIEPEVKERGQGGFGWEITTKYKYTDKSPDGNKLVDAALEEGLNTLGYTLLPEGSSATAAIQAAGSKGAAVKSTYEIKSFRQVDSTITETLLTSSFISIILSLIVIFAYIAFRFRKWQYGLGALLAMFHDVLVVLSLFSIFWGIMPFSMEIDQAFIAAILTVVGYSINDTVVVFDRIREYLGVHRKQDPKEVINKALNSTLSRTINTSLSTFIVLLVIFIFADSIRGFTFALMVGVIVGTYSSLCIATPSVVDLSKNFDANKKKKAKKA